MALLWLIVVFMTSLIPFSDTHAAQDRGPLAPGVDQVLHGSFAPNSAEECPTGIVLVSWNIERGVKHCEILQALRGPLAADLYLLQEVDLHTRRTGYRNIAEDMARELKMNYVLGIEFEELAQGRSGSPAFQGQAVLSRLPILRWRVLRFRHQPYNWGARWKVRWSWLQPRRGGRMALITEVKLRGRTWAIYNTHLESKTDDAGRGEQIREIVDDMHAHYAPDTPVIVAGDFNTEKGIRSPVLQDLRAEGFRDVLHDHAGPLRTKVRADERLDWILLRNLHGSDAQVPRVAISDHYPLTVRVTDSSQSACAPTGRPSAKARGTRH